MTPTILSQAAQKLRAVYVTEYRRHRAHHFTVIRKPENDA